MGNNSEASLSRSWSQVGAKLGPSWGQVGAKLGSSWPKLGPSWGQVGPSWGYVGSQGGHLIQHEAKVGKVRPKMLQLGAKITDFVAILAVPDVPKLCWEYSFSIVFV